MSTFITRLADGPAGGVRLAVKDLIDVAGAPTTAGSRAVAEQAEAARVDAPCLAGARAAGARIVGKANLYELAFGASGVNPWFGTPVNPLDPALVPGGSSSGSAVAVAVDEADVAYGSDTGGSIRVPSAFCGTVGLKTTWGRVPLDGVWPLAPSLDTVGPMARDVAGAVLGMQWLEPGFSMDGAASAGVVGRLRVRPDGLPVPVDPRIDAAVDAALRAAEFEVVDVEVPGWSQARRACIRLLDWEVGRVDGWLLDDPAVAAKLSAEAREDLEQCRAMTEEDVAPFRPVQDEWKARLAEVFERVPVLAMPTVPFFAPRLDEWRGRHYTVFTSPANLAGTPALAVPVPCPGAPGALPAGLQLVGPWGAEALLLATGARIESAAR